MGRNTQILEEIINVLTDQLFNKETAMRDLEHHFNTRLILDAGDVSTIATHASQLRLRVETEECGAVLDYIASNGLVGINVDVVEEAINSLLGEDRFIEPGE